jgi:hypothetical protein
MLCAQYYFDPVLRAEGLMLHVEPAKGGFPASVLSMLPWNQAKGQNGSSGEVFQHGACIQQISILRDTQEDRKQPVVVFSVLDRYSTVKLWQWS